jgi:hypothetical protein
MIDFILGNINRVQLLSTLDIMPRLALTREAEHAYTHEAGQLISCNRLHVRGLDLSTSTCLASTRLAGRSVPSRSRPDRIYLCQLNDRDSELTGSIYMLNHRRG